MLNTLFLMVSLVYSTFVIFLSPSDMDSKDGHPGLLFKCPGCQKLYIMKYRIWNSSFVSDPHLGPVVITGRG